MSDVEVAAYYFPNYHADARNETVHGRGWTEWDLVRRARPRFPGHDQPKIPAWGFEDEADPAVFARKIDAAADHGVSAFLFDWYRYDDGPFLARALEEGYLRAPNNRRVRFALMWANHDWIDIHPARLGVKPRLLYPGAVSRETFDAVAERVVRDYFAHPSYWKIDGRPYFSIYETQKLVAGLGGVGETRAALDGFRDRVRGAGFPDLHLNAVVWGLRVLPGERVLRDPAGLVSSLGIDSVTSYVWVHHERLDAFPTVDYAAYAERAAAAWPRLAGAYPVPYHPNVTMGWDPSPRTDGSDAYSDAGYPFTPVLAGNAPEAFRRALLRARDFLRKRPAPRILTLNAWNEWTEGSYLEPDTRTGLGYLESVRSVFGTP